MINKNFDVTLRIPEPNNIPMCFKVTQNDCYVYNLTVKVYDETEEIDYSEIESATITFVKMDGHVVQGNMTVGVSSLTYNFGTNEIACPGYVLASVQLIGSNNERLTTARFRFAVVPDLLSPSAIHSTTEFAELQRLKAELEGIDVVVLSNELAAHKAETTTQIISVVRDLSIIGVQSITTLANRKIKRIDFRGVVNYTKKICFGSYAEGVQVSICQLPIDSSYGQYAQALNFINDNTANRTSGVVQDVTDNGFKINWSIAAGSGATGTAVLQIIVTYHD